MGCFRLVGALDSGGTDSNYASAKLDDLLEVEGLAFKRTVDSGEESWS